ncbi:MAG TPA: thioredoxin [Bacteroidales bacterium]|nr:thioredoxin [Bacteroidales bacterium]
MKITYIIAIVVVFFAGYFIYSFRKMKNIPMVENSDRILELTDKNFQLQVKSNITLVDFWASWCVPCKMMAPVLNEVADEVPGNVKVCKVNVEQYRSLASKYSIRGIPTIVLFSDGKEVDRIVGVKTKDFIINRINKVK